MGRRAHPRTDFGTVLLHWMLVALLTASVLSGLRIATSAPHDLGWLAALDPILPQSLVWTAHMPVAIGFFGLTLAYAVYVRRAGLTSRIRLDRVRFMALLRRGPGRWNALATVITWVLFALLLLELVTGTLLYLGHGGAFAALHRLGMWMLIAFSAAHVATQFAIGGASQLARMLRPKPLPPPVPPFDLFDLIPTHDLPGAAGTPAAPLQGPQDDPGRRTPQATTLHAHPLAVAMAVGVVGMTMVTLTDQVVLRDTLHIRRIEAIAVPVLDGDPSDPVWRRADRIVVATSQGANLDGTGTSTVEIRAVHDGESVYFSFIWDDPTRSLKHLPLIKESDGWHVLHRGYDTGDEHAWHEDKLSVLLTTRDVLLAGDRTFHAGRAPAEGKPATFSGRGLHYTPDAGIADVWQWRAAHGGIAGFVDDGHFGPPAEPTAAQAQGREPYKGGYAADPGTTGAAANFEPRGPGGYRAPVLPRRLPLDLAATLAAMGRIDLDPDVGESEGARWWMSEAESLPYSPELDAQIPLGTVIPGVLLTAAPSGDRADIRCAARWLAGRWSLETARRLDTGSRFDVPIASGVFLRVAVFDHAQIRHTRHIRPIRIEVQ